MTDWAPLGRRVRQARLGRRLSQDELGDQIGLDRSAVARIEAGERKISVLEMLNVSTALSVPLSWLTDPQDSVVSRRRDLDDKATEMEAQLFSADVALDRAARDVEQMRDAGVIAPADHAWQTRVEDGQGAHALAGEVRTALGLGADPLPPMSDVAAELGMHIFVIDADLDGASLRVEPGLGAAVLGSSRDPGRRRMTAAHEIGHHVIGDEYSSDISVSSSRDEREQLIDAFAQEFLLPAAALPTAPTRESLIELASTYRVSWGVVVHAAQRLGTIGAAEAQHLRAHGPTLSDFLAVTGANVPEDLSLGSTSRTWGKAVMAALNAGSITRSRAMELVPGLVAADFSDVGDVPW